MYCQISKTQNSDIMQGHSQGNTVLGIPTKGIPTLGRQPHLVQGSTSTKPELSDKMDSWMGILTLRM